MAGRVEGKVAFITGAGRGQGRSHAVRLAEEGADIIAMDVLEDYPTVHYPMATADDLAETVRLVGGRRPAHRGRPGRRQGHRVAHPPARRRAWTQLGRLDIVSANAGICSVQTWDQVTPELWQDTLDTNLTGVWNTMVAADPPPDRQRRRSIIATSSTAGIKGVPFLTPYVAAKHGVVGIARSLANELARHHIRVNTVHPTGVNTPMLMGLGGLDPLLERRSRARRHLPEHPAGHD